MNRTVLGIMFGMMMGSLILYLLIPYHEHNNSHNIDYEEFVMIRETMFQKWKIDNIKDKQFPEEEITVLRNAYNAGCVFALTYCNVTHK